jgi:hypothetical protein
VANARSFWRTPTGAKNPLKWPYTGDPAGEHVLASETASHEPPELSSREHDGKKQNTAAGPGGRHERSEGDDLTGPHADWRTSNLCNNASAPLEQYSLLEFEPCPDMLKQHELERNLEGEIVQLKKERLIHTTRCQVYETIQT